jgi:endonuclease-3
MSPAKLKGRKERIKKLDRALKKLFPVTKTELNFKNPWQLMVAVQLSAQATDKGVNKATVELFRKYRTLDDYVRAGETDEGQAEFESYVKSINYHHNKTRNILGAAKMIKEKFKGKVPRTLPELLTLPGVARKTATIILSTAYGIIEGVTVDTHVIRFVTRYDLSDHKDPVKIERDLMELLPKPDWEGFSHRAIFYGRYLAPARPYDVSKDPLIKIYPPAAHKFRV